MLSNQVIRLSLLTSAAVFALGSGVAVAQSSGGTESPPQPSVADAQTGTLENVELVTVTARRRAESVFNVPIAESVVTADSLNDRGFINDLNGILADVPGVYFQNQGTSRLDDISVRGSSTGSANADGAVGLYRDGTYVGIGWQFDRNMPYIDTFDLSQVEVLRGPQGGLYGRNSEGGVILAETMKPQFNDSGYVKFNYGINTEAPDLQVAINEQLSDTVAFRLSGESVNQYGGFYKDIADGRYIEAGHGLIGRGQVRFENGPIDVNVSIEHQSTDGFGVNNQVREPAGTPGFPTGYFAPIFTNELVTFPREDTEINDAILTANYNFDFGTLTSISSIRERKDYDLTDTDQMGVAQLAMLQSQVPPQATTLTTQSLYNYVINKSYSATRSENLYFAGNKFDGITWLVGLELLDNASSELQDQRTTPAGATTPNNGNETAYHYIFTSYSPYLDLTYDILNNLSVEGSVRYESDHKELTVVKYTELAPTPVPYESPKSSTNYTSYNVALTYHPTSDVMLYAKTATGYRAGGFNPPSLSTVPANDPVQVQLTYGNESTTSYEIGAKGNPLSWLDPGEDWLTTDVALYKNSLRGLLTQVTNGCNLTNVCHANADLFLVNGGNGNQWGLEVSATAHFPLLGGDAVLTASGSDQQGTFSSGHTATLASLRGRSIPQEARWIAALNLNYTHPFVYSTNFIFNANYSGQWGGLNDLSTLLPLPDHDVLDLRSGVRFENWEAAIYCKNCGNQLTVVYIGSINGFRWSEPRTYGFDLHYNW